MGSLSPLATNTGRSIALTRCSAAVIQELPTHKRRRTELVAGFPRWWAVSRPCVREEHALEGLFGQPAGSRESGA